MRRTVVALTVLALTAAACSSDSPTPDPDPTSALPSPSETASAAPEPSPEPTSEPAATGLRELGAPRDLGPGTVVGPTPDGRMLYVLSPEPESDIFGCEGAPFDVLWIVDPATGDRQRAIDVPVDDHPFVTDVLLDGAPDGRVAMTGSCEGFLGAVLVGDVDEDGTITGISEVPLPPIELLSWTLRWIPGGTDLVATGDEQADSPGVYVIDADSGDWIDIDERPLDDWIPFADGVIAEVDEGRVRLLDGAGTLLGDFTADDIVASPMGLPALAFRYDYSGETPTGTISLINPGGTRTELDDDAQGFAGSLSPDGSVAAWAESDPDTFDTTLVLHDVATGRQVRLDDVWFAGTTFVEGGIAYVIEGPDTDADFGDPIVRFRPWDD